MPFNADTLKGTKPAYDLVDADTGKVVVEMGKKLTPRLLKQLEEKGPARLSRVGHHEINGSYVAEDIVNMTTGEIYIEAGGELTAEINEKSGEFEGTLIDLVERRCQGCADTRYRPRQRWRLYPQCTGGRQERKSPGGSVRYLSRHASRRAADNGYGGSYVPVAVLRLRTLRSVCCWPCEDEHASWS